MIEFVWFGGKVAFVLKSNGRSMQATFEFSVGNEPIGQLFRLDRHCKRVDLPTFSNIRYGFD